MYVLKRFLLIFAASFGAIVPALFLIIFNTPSGGHEFPLTVSTSGIVLEKLQKYDGVYFEDQSEEQVKGIAAGIFVNKGSQLVESAYIELYLQNDKYTFEICMLPPGMRIMVLDARKMAYSGCSVLDYSVVSTVCAYEYNDMVDVQVLEESFQLINKDDNAVSVSVYHRLWSKQGNMYLGGTAYKTYIKDFAPDDVIYLKAGFTFPKDSKIIYIAKMSRPANADRLKLL